MMKKKNIAMAVAAMTVATSVAPAFASTVEKDIMVNESAKLVSKVRELLSIKYTDEKLGNVYTITTNLKLDEVVGGKLVEGQNEITNPSKLAQIIELLGKSHGTGDAAGVNSKDLVVTITDNGHAEVNGEIVDETVLKYEKASELSALQFSDVVCEDEGMIDSGSIVSAEYDIDKSVLNVSVGFKVAEETASKEEIETAIGSDETVKYDELKSTIVKTFAVKMGDAHLNIYPNDEVAYPTDYANVRIDAGRKAEEKNKLASEVFNTDAAKNKELVLSQIEKLKTTNITKTGLETIATEDVAKVTVKDTLLAEVKSEDLFDGLQLTSKGQELIDSLAKDKVEIDEKEYKLTAEAGNIEKVTDSKVRATYYKMPVTISKQEVKAGSLVGTKTEMASMTITNTTREELVKVAEMLEAPENGARVSTIAGSTRFTTAVEVSKELEKSGDLGKENVVLVNSSALVDGLAATPFATDKKAPILLTNKDSVDADTMNRIKEILVNETPVNKLDTKTVYLIGGESVISPAVEKQLKDVGVTVERIAGANRVETSLELAERVMKANPGSKTTDAFVVGFNGEADAMSIASKAAELKAPIVVAQNTLTRDAKKLLDGKNVDIIGGTTAVSKDAEAELKSIDKDKKVKRVEGSNRKQTNANVIKEYYSTVDTVLVAKDGQGEQDKLIDALSAGPLAAGLKAPIVLATESLSVEQNEILDLRLASDANVKQIGNGVNDSIIKTIAKKLGLIK